MNRDDVTANQSTDRPTTVQTVQQTDQQTAFRVRSDFTAGLNADQGWAGALNENVTVNVEEPFRIRFEVESPEGANEERRFRLQYRRNGGEWTNVDAQGFPMPMRELELEFETNEVGERPEGWNVVRGNGSDMEVAADGQQSFLRVQADQEPILAIGLYETRWGPTEIAAEIRLPQENQSGTGIVFGYVDPENYSQVYLDPAGVIRVSRFVDGRETAITERETRIASGQWLEVQIQTENGEAEIEFEGGGTLEFTANLGAAIPPSQVGFYVPANSTAEFRTFAIEGETATPRVSIVSTPAYEYGAETTDLLPGSSAPYSAGAGVNLAEITPSVSEGGIHSEWEWPLVIRRFADGAVTNNEGDTFEFRMADAGGRPLGSDSNPVITVSVPPGLLAGTFVETPARVGPWEASNGDLYFIMEPSETYNVLMVVKSSDGGETWQEVDGANRPATGDLEGFASDLWGDTIHMLHQTSDEVLHHAFRTSDHPTNPDTWVIRDDTVATPAEPPTQVATMAVRSDGSIVGVYGGPEKIHFKIRSPAGTWGDETIVDADVPPNLSGPQVVLGEGDVVHLAYTGSDGTDGTAWYRRIQPDGTLTPREQLATGIGTSEGDVGSVLPLVFIPETNTAVVIYRLATGKLWERRIVEHGAPTDPVQVSERDVVQNAVDADQTGADAIAHGTTVHVLFIEQGSGSILHTHSGEAGVWQPAALQVDGVRAQWIRGTLLTHGGASVYGYVYDAGSDGGSGMNRYAEVPLGGR